MNDLISIIVNVYNGEKYIKKCLDCIINQTYKNLEILIINDGSTDKTLNIIKTYKDKRIRVISTKNKGLSLSRNVGIDNAKGEYLYFIDVDDFVEKDTIEYLYNLCKKYNTPMSTCKSLDIYDYTYKVKEVEEKIDILSGKDMLKRILLHINNATTIWNKLIKKELFDNIRFEDRITDDVAVTYKLVMGIDKIVLSNKIKYYYYRHNESITIFQKKNIDRLIDVYKVSIDRYNYIKNIYPDLIENDTSMLKTIVMLYSRDNIIKEYLKKENSLILYKNLFSLNALKCNIGIKEKIKLILFRINPKLYSFIINTYLKMKREI